MRLPSATVAHVSLPFTVLKLIVKDYFVGLTLLGVAHVSLPFTVLKPHILKACYDIISKRCACLLTVYGFETFGDLLRRGLFDFDVAHVSLPFTVLKPPGS